MSLLQVLQHLSLATVQALPTGMLRAPAAARAQLRPWSGGAHAGVC